MIPQKPVVWLAGTRSNRDVLERAAKSAYLEPLNLPAQYQGTPREIIRELDGEIASTQAEDRRAGGRPRLAFNLAPRQVLHKTGLGSPRQPNADRGHRALRADCGIRTWSLGWVPTESLDALTARLRQVSKETLLESMPASRNGEQAERARGSGDVEVPASVPNAGHHVCTAQIWRNRSDLADCRDLSLALRCNVRRRGPRAASGGAGWRHLKPQGSRVAQPCAVWAA